MYLSSTYSTVVFGLILMTGNAKSREISSLQFRIEKIIKPVECRVASYFEPERRRDDYDYVDGLGSYKIYYDDVKTWEDARATCIKDGAHLAIIDSEAEKKHLGAMLRNKQDEEATGDLRYWNGIVWIGVHQDEGTWTNVCGEPADNYWGEYFEKQYPIEHGGKCGSLLTSYYDKFGIINAVQCDQKLGFICEL